ncbi:hypothetical protein TrVGV298_000794 [Trichoderma virens]|nr:hypothetical protein TrVGV298_000794 [Trichoderma virens]
MSNEEPQSTFGQEDHQVAFVFDPEENEAPRRERDRPSKRRKTGRRAAVDERDEEDEESSASWFAPLLNGAESAACVQRRERLLEENWAKIDARIQDILRDSNSATLDEVSQFVNKAKSECGDKIPSAFIITGPNIASQDLLFEQLSDSLQRSSPSKFIRLRSSEATNLKNALKKIIQDATSKTLVVDGEEDLQLGQGSNRRYLPYDLEALHVFLEHQPQENVFVAFQDSEAFDSGLLSDIITLLRLERGEGILQAEHIEALRHLPSFRHEVETAVGVATADSLQHARSLIEDDEYLLAQARANNERRQDWMDGHLRLLLIREAAGAVQPPFSRAYVDSLSTAYPNTGNGSLTEHIRRMGSGALISMLRRIISIFKDGEPSFHLEPASREQDAALLNFLEETLRRLEQLQADAESAGMTLHTKYSSQSKVMRTTVIAQRVQLSRDSAALRDEDKQLTDIVDAVSERLTAHFGTRRPEKVLFSETWLYDSRSPLRDVMVPRPRVTFRRSLARPYDYLSCSCCRSSGAEDGVVQATLPATSILYHLYLEAGSLINVADLWSAFHTLVREEKGDDDDGEKDDEQRQQDERKALVMFYRGLAELKAMGFVKSSKKKTDHIAKVRWL